MQLSLNATFISYALATLAFAGLGVAALLDARRARIAGLATASMLSALWAGFVAADALRGHSISLTAALLELARDAAWLYFLIDLLIQRQGTATRILRVLSVSRALLLIYSALLMLRIMVGEFTDLSTLSRIQIGRAHV